MAASWPGSFNEPAPTAKETWLTAGVRRAVHFGGPEKEGKGRVIRERSFSQEEILPILQELVLKHRDEAELCRKYRISQDTLAAWKEEHADFLDELIVIDEATHDSGGDLLLVLVFLLIIALGIYLQVLPASEITKPATIALGLAAGAILFWWLRDQRQSGKIQLLRLSHKETPTLFWIVIGLEILAGVLCFAAVVLSIV